MHDLCYLNQLVGNGRYILITMDIILLQFSLVLSVTSLYNIRCFGCGTKCYRPLLYLLFLVGKSMDLAENWSGPLLKYDVTILLDVK